MKRCIPVVVVVVDDIVVVVVVDTVVVVVVDNVVVVGNIFLNKGGL